VVRIEHLKSENMTANKTFFTPLVVRTYIYICVCVRIISVRTVMILYKANVRICAPTV
jgi:hypothetical protein